MEDKTLQILEYPKILERLGSFAGSAAGRELCLKLRPSSNYRHIREWQQNTTDAKDRIRLKGAAPSFRGLAEIRDILKRVEVGAVLSPGELLKVSGALSVAERAVSYGREGAEDSLSESFAMITPLTAVNREIMRCILSEEEIADDASPGLAAVRGSMKRAADSVREVMQARLNACRDYLTDAVITQRDGRFCLPVRAEYKAKVPGMVHDMSSTGLTLFIEPMAVVSLNNRLRELQIQEQQEIEKVLRSLSEGLAPHTDVLADNIKLLKKLDMIFAKALYSMEIDGTEPSFSKDRSIDFKEARHPLIDRDRVVPVSVRLGRDFDLLVVTGPNTGGKTVSLKTVGLLSLMAQAGLHIPAAEGSSAGIFQDIYADIGDEQSIEQSLSTFSAHMTNIVSILEKADAQSLCLFDELGSGTDPTEGAALGIAILSFLHRMKTRTMATTHYSEIKLFAIETEGVENACCEFDVATLRPTYRLLIGIPGKSNAFAISARLGLPEYIIEEARRHIASENENFEDIITRLNEERSRTEKSMAEAESFRKDAEILKERLRKKEARLEESRDKILKEAKEEAARILREAKETADTAIREIGRYVSEGDQAGAEAQRERIRKSLKESTGGGGITVKGPARPVSPKKLKEGDTVRVMSMGGVTGTVSSLPDKDGFINVRMGFMNSRVSVREVELAEGGAGDGRAAKSSPGSGRRDASGQNYGGDFSRDFGSKALTIRPELNLIGMTTDEALPELEKYLDDAYLSGLESVRIVHGRGTGALKNMVHQRLKGLRYVKSYRLGVFGEGDTGVTVVTFKS